MRGASARLSWSPPKDYEKPVTGPSSIQEPVAEAAAVAGPRTAVAEPSTAVAGPSTAVEEAAPVEAADSTSAVKSRPLVQPPAPTTSEAVPDTAEGAPLAAGTVVGGKKMGNTGSLVSQDDKVQPGCLCFSAPGSKKGKKTGTIGTDAPIYAGPAVTGNFPLIAEICMISEYLSSKIINSLSSFLKRPSPTCYSLESR